MLRAVYNGMVLAEAPRTVRVEGNHYFPPHSLNGDYFTRSTVKTVCPWKGLASYYSVGTERDTMPNAAWSYRWPLPLARRIKGHVAFDGVVVTVEGESEPRPEGERGFRAAMRRLLRPTEAV